MTPIENIPRMFFRNRGIINPSEQQIFSDSVVALAGAGGDGGMLAVQLARMGIGELRFADPDPFEEENINRQACCTVDTIGVNKAIAVGEYVQKINPNLKVTTYTDGIHKDNVAEFVHGADLLIDETEFSLHAVGVMLAREARKQDIPNLMALNVGFGALITTYKPKGKTLESVLGLSEKASIKEIADHEVSITKWLADLPSYADLNVFLQVSSGKKTEGNDLAVPSVAPGVAIAAGAAATQAALNLWNGENHRPFPVYAPRVRSIDVMSGISRDIRYPKLRLTHSLLTMFVRSKLGLNPQSL